MSKSYQSVVVIIDDFSAAALNYDNVSLYNYNNNDYVLQTSLNETGDLHGDWVVDTFFAQLDNTDQVDVILIDMDVVDGSIDLKQFEYLFSKTGWGPWARETVIEGVIETWLLNNNSDFVEYIPVALSYSISGYDPGISESYAIEYLMNNATALIQASTNVNLDAPNWSNTFSDVISVGAYNIDSNNDFLYTNPVNDALVDLLANGYVYNDNGLTKFGTSFATPRVSAEIVNLMSSFLQQINTLLSIKITST